MSEGPVVLAPSLRNLPAVIIRPGGTTLHPGDGQTDAELQADEEARVSERVGGFLRSGFAQARARNGLPDPAVGALGHALREATDDVPSFIDVNSPAAVAKALHDGWAGGAERYGKTGSPYAEPEGRLESIERPSAIVAAAATGNADALAMTSFLSAGARLQEFADGRAGLELFALVEIRQGPSGSVESVSLTRPSGLKPFDAWVLERAAGVTVSLGVDGGWPARANRSVWRFDGVLTFRRKAKLSELNGRAVVGMLTMVALSMLSGLGNNTESSVPGGAGRPMGPRMPGALGRFEETTGEVDFVDLTNPSYDCRVTLLEAD